MALTLLSLVIDAVSYGMALFIISIGLSIMMGLMRVVNLAHGAFAMIGGYFASYALVSLGAPYLVAALIAVAGTIVVSIPFELLLYRRIYRKSDSLTQLLLTIGITFFIIGVMNFVFGPTVKPIPAAAVAQRPGRYRLSDGPGPSHLRRHMRRSHRARALGLVRPDRLRRAAQGRGR